MARLQEQVGAVLLRRAGRGVILTPQGELLARRAREILRRIDDATAEVGALSRQLDSRLRIAAFQSALLELIPPALASMRTDRADIALELRESHPDDALELLRENEIDVAIVHRHDNAAPGEDLAAVKLYDDPVYLLSTFANDTVAAHRDSSWIAGCERCSQGIEDLCLTAGFKPKIPLRTEDIHVQASLVAAGIGVISMPGTALRSLNMSTLRATPLPGLIRRVWVATSPSSPAITREFVESIVAAVTKLGLAYAGRQSRL
jgi:DNA-binding transcriptional LysR family regulator